MSQKLLAAYAVLASALNTAWALPSNTESSTNTVQNRADLSSACAASMNNVIPSPTPSGFVFSGTVRRYYIAAEEIEWDYAPTGWDNWLGVPLDISPRAQYAGALIDGTKWLKALYRGYTDSTFSTLTPQPLWQGTQGPTIRSEVGDMVEIMFTNKLTKNYATMHSMGLAYTKDNEGAVYPNNTTPGEVETSPESGAVPPGGCVVYKWLVTDTSGPQMGQPARLHSYHSYVTYQQDTNAGLIGPHIVYAPGMMNSTMANYREFPLLYMIYDESNSWLSGENAALLQSNSSSSSPSSSSPSPSSAAPPTSSPISPSAAPSAPSSIPSSYPSAGSPPYTGGHGWKRNAFTSINPNTLYTGNYSYWHPQLVNLAGVNQFPSAPRFYSMNGYIFANNPTYEMCANDKAIWYVMAYGSASHVFHMHGNGFTHNGVRSPAISINDGVMKTLYMNATGIGKWQVICHIGNHHDLGMVSNYQVYPAGQCPLPALGQ